MPAALSSGAASCLAGAWKGRRCGAGAARAAAAAYGCAAGSAAARVVSCGLGRGALKAGRLPLPPLPRSTTAGGRDFRAAAAAAAAAGAVAASSLPPPPPPPWISLGEQGASTATTMFWPKERDTSSPSARASPSCKGWWSHKRAGNTKQFRQHRTLTMIRTGRIDRSRQVGADDRRLWVLTSSSPASGPEPPLCRSRQTAWHPVRSVWRSRPACSTKAAQEVRGGKRGDTASRTRVLATVGAGHRRGEGAACKGAHCRIKQTPTAVSSRSSSSAPLPVLAQLLVPVARVRDLPEEHGEGHGRERRCPSGLVQGSAKLVG